MSSDEGAEILEISSDAFRKRLSRARDRMTEFMGKTCGLVDAAKLKSLEKGLTLEGISYGPIRAELVRAQGSNAWLTMSLQEGKNREIRRVLGHLGLDVTRLIRIAYGPFQLGHLQRGGVEEVPRRVLREQLGAEEMRVHADRRR